MTEEEQLNRRARRAAKKNDGDEPAHQDPNARVRAVAEERYQLKGKTKKAAPSVQAEGLDASEIAGDALVRGTDAAGRFFSKNARWLQWVAVLGLAAGMGKLIYDFRAERSGRQQGDRVGALLMAGVGRIAGEGAEKASDPRLTDNRPEFESQEARLQAASQQYAALSGKIKPELQVELLLSLAALQKDGGKLPEARKSYETVLHHAALNAPGADADRLRGRALEGLLFLEEGDGKLEEALKHAKQLAGVSGQKDLGEYHQARILFLQGEKTKAAELLKELNLRLNKKLNPLATKPYLAAAAEDLAKTVDPKSAPSGGISPEQLEQLKRQIEAMQQGGSLPGGAPAPGGAPQP